MSTDLKSYIGSRIKAIRESKPRGRRFTQAQLAAKIGRATETVANIERGFALTGLATLHDICKVLDVPLGSFFEDFETERNKSRGRLDRESRAVNAIKRLNDAQLKTVETMLEGLVSRK